MPCCFMCLATSVKVIIFHNMYVFVWVLIRNLFCSGRGEQYLISFKAEMCNRILCDAQKKCWRDITECVGTVSMSQATMFRWWKHFKDGNKRVVDDARNERPSTAVTDDNGYLGSKLWSVFTMQIHLKLTCGMVLREKKTRVLDGTVVFASRQYMAAYCTVMTEVLADISWIHV
jgi:hypothetical protein